MKKSVYTFTFLILVAGLLFTSCISNKKFMASEARGDKLQKENAITPNVLNETKIQLMKLKDEKASIQKENEIMQKEYALIQKNLMMRFSESKMTIAEQARRLAELQNMIDSQVEITTWLKNSIGNALRNYKTDELTVYLKDGNVYASLAEKLLFKIG